MHTKKQVVRGSTRPPPEYLPLPYLSWNLVVLHYTLLCSLRHT